MNISNSDETNLAVGRVYIFVKATFTTKDNMAISQTDVTLITKLIIFFKDVLAVTITTYTEDKDS